MNKNDLLEKLKNNISRETWNNWLSDCSVELVNEKEVVLGLSNIFVKDKVEKNFGSVIKDTLVDILERNVEVTFSTKTIDNSKKKEEYTGPLIKNRPLKLSDFNSEYTFKSFIVGESNSMAFHSAMEASKSPGKYNPLFIYGDVGLGKTHLQHAIANRILEHSPDLKVKYLTAEDFMNDMMDSIRATNMEAFRERYRKTVDILLIDDVQFLIGKNSVQTELFHTFNSLFNMGKQVVICSDRTPEELATFNPRLVSRFEMGLVVNIQEPDEGTRYLIAKKMADLVSVQITDDVAHYLAENINRNLRRLRGAIMNLMLHSKVTGEPVNLTSAKKIVDSLIRMNMNKTKYRTKEAFETIKLNTLINAVLQKFNLKKEELYSNSRKKEIANARQILAYLMKTKLNIQLKDIAEALKRNHSTINHAIKKIEHSLMIGNKVTKTSIDDILKIVENEKMNIDIV
jgi:chromosomal replication initiator protein